MIEKAKCSAAVLAGGYSSRMGQDKAALAVNESTMLEHMVRKLRALGLEDIMISGSVLTAEGARNVPDVYPHRGPLSGIHSCLREAKGDAVLFLSVDLPFFPAETLQSLLGEHGGSVTLLRQGGQWEPLIGIYDKSVLPLCDTIIREENTSPWRVINASDTVTVEYTGPEEGLFNCNTPEDYAELKRRLAHDKGNEKDRYGF